MLAQSVFRTRLQALRVRHGQKLLCYRFFLFIANG